MKSPWFQWNVSWHRFLVAAGALVCVLMLRRPFKELFFSSSSSSEEIWSSCIWISSRTRTGFTLPPPPPHTREILGIWRRRRIFESLENHFTTLDGASVTTGHAWLHHSPAKQANAHESIHILMEDIGDFVAFKQLVTCLYNVQFGQQHDS